MDNLQTIYKCSKCEGNIDIRTTQSSPSEMLIENQKYKCFYFQCPTCNEIFIFCIDNDLTYKVFQELYKQNLIIENYVNNNCTIGKKMKEKNIKLRMKLQLLRQTLYKNLDGKDYQLFSLDGKLVKTGKFELPNF